MVDDSLTGNSLDQQLSWHLVPYILLRENLGGVVTLKSIYLSDKFENVQIS